MQLRLSLVILVSVLAAQRLPGACNFRAHIEAVGVGTNVTKHGFAALKPNGLDPKIFFKKTVATGAALKHDAVGSGSYACISCHIDNRRNESETSEFLSGASVATLLESWGVIKMERHEPERGSMPAVNFSCTSVRTNTLVWSDPSCSFGNVAATETNGTPIWEENHYQLILSNYFNEELGEDGGENVGEIERRTMTSTDITLETPYSLTTFLGDFETTVGSMSYPDWTNATRYGIAEKGGTDVAPGAGTNAPPTTFSARLSKFQYRIAYLGPKKGRETLRWYETFHPSG